jgi:hypothetical protein
MRIDLHTEMGWWKIIEVTAFGVSALAQLRKFTGRICVPDLHERLGVFQVLSGVGDGLLSS